MRFGAEDRIILVLAVVLFALLGNACAQTKEQKMEQIKEHTGKARPPNLKKLVRSFFC